MLDNMMRSSLKRNDVSLSHKFGFFHNTELKESFFYTSYISKILFQTLDRESIQAFLLYAAYTTI